MATYRILGLFVSCLALALIFVVGGAGVYLKHNPEEAAATAIGTMAFDPKAGDEAFSRRSSKFIEERYGPLGGSGSVNEAPDPTYRDYSEHAAE